MRLVLQTAVLIKYLFQFGFFPWNQGHQPQHWHYLPRLLGIEKKDKYAAWDLALLMTLFLHRSILKVLFSRLSLGKLGRMGDLS